MEVYPIKYNEEIIGKAGIQTEGLYYKIDCVCTLPLAKACYIYVSVNGRATNLGRCLLRENTCILNRFIPIKEIGCGNPEFSAVESEAQCTFVPLDSKKPFPNLLCISKGYFKYCDGIAGILTSA